MDNTGERFLPLFCNDEMKIEHYQRYLFAQSLVDGKSVLDVASGEGYGSAILSQTANSVIGLDIECETVRSANARYAKSNLSYVEGEATHLPFLEEAFDVVVSFETIEHLNTEEQEIFLSEIKRVLKKDGSLIMSTPNKYIYTDLVQGENKFHLKEFYAEEYVDFLERYFDTIDVYCQYPDTAYIIAKEGHGGTYVFDGKKREESRYLIAVCANGKKNSIVDTEKYIRSSDEMYYTLNRYSHELEKKIEMVCQEAMEFQQHLTNDIAYLKQTDLKNIEEHKNYVEHLEKDIVSLKGDIQRLLYEKRKQDEWNYHLETDIVDLKTYIEMNNKQNLEQHEYTIHLEEDIHSLKVYVERLEKDNMEQQGYITYLEKNIVELKEYIVQLESNSAE